MKRPLKSLYCLLRNKKFLKLFDAWLALPTIAWLFYSIFLPFLIPRYEDVKWRGGDDEVNKVLCETRNVVNEVIDNEAR